MSLLLAMAFVVLSGFVEPQTDITAADIVAGYWQNYASFRVLRVQLKTTHRYGENWVAREQQTLERALRKAEGASEPERGDAIQEAEDARMRLEDPRYRPPDCLFQDFWTDRVRYQQRVPQEPLGWNPRTKKMEKPTRQYKTWSFPDDPPNGDTLLSRYQHYRIISYLGEAGMRYWDGLKSANVLLSGRGGVVQETKEFLQPVPPLAVLRTQPTEYWHAFDVFFSLPIEELRVLGTEMLDGRLTYVLEHARENTNQQTWLLPEQIEKYGTRLKRFNTTRAWVDPERGWLPLRMEWGSYLLLDGKRIGPNAPPAGYKPPRVIEEVEIAYVPGGGYYPVRGVERTYALDVNWKPPDIPFEERLAGKAPREIPCRLEEETRWEALSVSADVKMPDEVFALLFPANTMYIDIQEGKVFVTGGAQQYLDRAIGPAGQAPGPREEPALRRNKVMAWIGLGIVALVLVWLLYRRILCTRAAN